MDEGKRKKEIELLMEEFARLRVEDINCQNAKFELEERIAEKGSHPTVLIPRIDYHELYEEEIKRMFGRKNEEN